MGSRRGLVALMAAAMSLSLTVGLASAADWTAQTMGGDASVMATAALNTRGDVLIAWVDLRAYVVAATRQPDGSFTTQMVGTLQSSTSIGLPGVALDAEGNATVAWSDDRGLWVARHRPGQAFAPAQHLATQAGLGPLAAAGTSETIVAWDEPTGDSWTPSTVKVAIWRLTEDNPRLQTIDTSSSGPVDLQMNAADDALLLWNRSLPESFLATRSSGSDFGTPETPGGSIHAAALTADGQIVASWGPTNAVGDIGYRAPGGAWVSQGKEFAYDIVVQGTGEALARISRPEGWRSVLLRPGAGPISDGPPITSSGNTRVYDMAPNARGGVSAVLEDWAEAPRLATRDGTGPFAPTFNFTGDGLQGGSFAYGPGGGELALAAPARPGPFIVATRDIPPPPPPPQPATDSSHPPVLARARLDLSIPGRQRVLRTGKLRMAVACNELCSIRLRAAGVTRRVKVTQAGHRTPVTLKLTSRSRKRLRHYRVKRIKLSATAQFASGQWRTVRRSVRVSR